MQELSKLKRAIHKAKLSIYDGARLIGKWNGFEVYEPIFADNEPHYIGFPQFIIAKANKKGNKMRWANAEEARAIMDKFSSNKD